MCLRPRPARPLRALGSIVLFSSAAEPGRHAQDPGAAAQDTYAPSALEVKYQRLEATADGWTTEVFNDRAGKQLKEITKRLQDPAALGADPPAIVTEDFACERLRPLDLEVALDGRSIDVQRANLPNDRTVDEVHRGASGLKDALRELRAPFDPDAKLSMELMKIVRVEPAKERVFTTSLVRLRGPAAGGILQQDGEWLCEWEPPRGELPPLLRSIRLLRFEESRTGNGPLFEECTAAVLGDDPAYARQILPHLETWLSSIPARVFQSYYGHFGLALGDADGNGLEDLYLCQPGGLPNRLFLHRPDGTAVDASAEARVDFLEPSRSALFLDLDGDLDQDLFLSIGSAVVALENDGAARFKVRWKAPLQPYSLAAADYDADGDLDVYCCEYKIPDSDGATPVPYHDATNGTPNVLWRNDGDWKFADATAESGLDENNRKYSFAACWEDYDNDGDQDLSVANDFGRDNLYRNDGGRFTDVAAAAGVDDIAAGMSSSWGDIDNDGWMDLYIGNMYSGAGNRIAFQPRFAAETGAETHSFYKRHAAGNTLFRNRGDGTFEDVSAASGTSMALWSWSSPFIDMNNDGLLDLVVNNGFLTSDDPKDL